MTTAGGLMSKLESIESVSKGLFVGFLVGLLLELSQSTVHFSIGNLSTLFTFMTLMLEGEEENMLSSSPCL